MNIGVDAREIQNGVVTGIGRSLANFIIFFCENERTHQLILFAEKNVPLNVSGNVSQVKINSISTFLWDQIKLPRALRSYKIDLFYSPYYKIPLLSHIPVVNQVLDLMYLAFPIYRDELGFWSKVYYATLGKTYSKKSINTITDSEHAKSDIVKFWNVEPKKIAVIPLGLAERYRPVKDVEILETVKKKFNLPEKYILYLGNFKPHKNVKSLVRAYKKISEQLSGYALVLAGPLDVHGQLIIEFVSELGLNKRVLFTDTIKEEDHPEALLSMADLFVFPSLYEGFGLPPLEAMACGTPVVTSNMTSIPEVVGDAGLSVNPLNINEISKAISDLIDDPLKRKIYSENGLKRAMQFREKQTAGKLFNHIISLLEHI